MPRLRRRIVSLVPSITENLILFGAPPMGRTSFCIEPKERVASIPVVGGTKTPNIKKIVELSPDLVLMNQEENRKEDVEALRARGVEVWVCYPTTVASVIPLMKELAKLSQTELQAEPIIEECEKVLRHFKRNRLEHKNKVLTLIWKDPWMIVGQETYIGDMIKTAGGIHLGEQWKGRYPSVSLQEILNSSLDLLLLPSEPYPFTGEDQKEWEARFSGAKHIGRVELISGEDLSWFGPRLVRGLTTLSKMMGGV